MEAGSVGEVMKAAPFLSRAKDFEIRACKTKGRRHRGTRFNGQRQQTPDVSEHTQHKAKAGTRRHTHTHTHTHTHIHARTHACTHARTHPHHTHTRSNALEGSL